MKRPLRKWQEMALEKWRDGGKDFLTCAAVGAGKTYLASLAAKEFIDRYPKGQILIVTNSRNLVKNWVRSGAEVGLNLKGINSNAVLVDGLNPEAHGYVMTYAALGSDPDLHESLVNRRVTLVIIDEIHHLEEGAHQEFDSIWCEAAKRAFSNAMLRLSLSGTPFRSSGKPIPFITYEEVSEQSGLFRLKPDFTYSYGEAVADNVCRQTVFKPYDGPIRYRCDQEEFEVAFADNLNPFHTSERLRNYNKLHPDNHLLIKVFTEANEALMALREREQDDAGGLIIANDQPHARHLKRFLEDAVGEKAELILSDEEDAQDKLERFIKGSRPWIIAVRMVSEGVDIPRLRVLIYCTHITEELFFTQAMGRIVRVGDNPWGPAYLFMPADQRLIEIANRIEAEVERVRREREKHSRDAEGSPGEGAERAREFIGAEGEQQNNIVGGGVFEKMAVDNAEALRTKYPEVKQMSVARLTQLYMDIAKSEEAEEEAGTDETTETWDETQHRLRSDVNRRVRRYCKKTEALYSHVFTDLFAAVGAASFEVATVAQLKAMKQRIEEMLDGSR